MNRISSSQAMGIPAIRVQDPFAMSPYTDSRSYPRAIAIPNARDDAPPGIPSMEPPREIFCDYRHQIPSYRHEGAPANGGISGLSSLKEQFHRFDAARFGNDDMDIDTDRDGRSPDRPLGNPPYQY